MDMFSDFTMTIDGRGVQADNAFAVIDPATEEVVGEAPDAAIEHLNDAVSSARRAQPGWAATPWADRQAALRAISARLVDHTVELGRLLTQEQGKPFAEAQFEVGSAARFAAAVATQTADDVLVEDSELRRIVKRYVPLGVVGAIAPWNFPVLLGMWKVYPALLAGNTVILKPSPFTPLTSLKIGEILRDVLPAGVFNVLSGGDSLGPWLTEHSGIDKVSFTGSTRTGQAVMRSAAANLKRVTLELGGNDPAIVLPDFDVENRIGELFWAAFRNAGQICMATKRLYVHTDIYDRVRVALRDYAATVRVGPGFEQGVQMGPIQNRAQFQRVRALVEDCRQENMRFLTGEEVEHSGTGFFMRPMIVDNPPEDSRVVREEAFGPLLPLLRYETIDEVVARANDSAYGLAASIWSEDSAKAAEVGARLQCGTVWTNEVHFISPFAPFGGHKQSGLGVENGVEGLHEYMNVQSVFERKRVIA